MKLLRRGEIVDMPWQRIAPGLPVDAPVVVPQLQLVRDGFEPPQTHWVVLVEPEDDPVELPEAALERDAILIEFPVFTDGRGYSHARTLRQELGYRGELVAVGDVRRDQLEFMRLVGIDSYQCAPDADIADLQHALTELRPDA
ncbi:MAG: DUF934 domain-containing protein [Pseudomonadota bacterium]